MTEPLCIVVDDNAINAMLLEQALLARGCRTYALTCPLTVEQVISDCGETPAMVVIDQCMPELPGHLLARNLRGRFGDQCLMVAWSGSALPAEAHMAFDEVLEKPINAIQLDRLVASFGLGDQPAPMDALSAAEQAQLLHLFADTTAEDLRQLARAIMRKDAGQAQALHHKMEGCRAMLALEMPSLSTMGEAIREQDWSAIGDAYLAVNRELTQVTRESP
ncbi:response regulator [Ferrimonas balearica]|uniref:response regulator n=1 Tax=Ferrimonas balearica TaxID=44012 RepID=UPI001C95F0E8|nr:hypothetical protein [Ferrimonas balearica]MBY6223865.1 hypothetical protein [Ferrimonas balearica]